MGNRENIGQSVSAMPSNVDQGKVDRAGDRARRTGYRRVLRSLAALQDLRDIEEELREHASGSQDGYLLDVANRMKQAIKNFQT
jgi:hypothetical protein